MNKACCAGGLAWCMAIGGCGRLVGHKEYIDTAMKEGGATAAVLPYVPPEPAPAPTADRTGIVLATDLPLGDSLGGPSYTGPGSNVARSYASDVRRQVDVLTRRMNLLRSRAEIKGAPAQAALDPHLRAFNEAVDRLDSGVASRDVLRDAAGIEQAFAEASRAVSDAELAVDATRALGENRSGT